MRILALMLALLTVTPALAKAPTIYVTRHYDTPEGERDPDLLPQGQQRAAQLAKWFAGKKLKLIYVSDFKRTRQTAAPLATAKQITPETYDPRDPAAIVARARTAKGPVLIVGHSNTVPELIERLGGPRPAELRHEDFGSLWKLRGKRVEQVRIAP